MKKLFLTLAIGFMATVSVMAQEFQQITVVESVVPGGLGRSRIISTDANGQLVETNLENFFSLAGINFGNIQNNDKVITDKLNKMTKEGWALVTVNTGVYGADKSTGIFITRYLFKK